MAQDFGDDMGNALLNFVTRQTENYLRFGRGRERAFDWWQRHYKKEGNTPEAAKAMAEKQSSREQVVVPLWYFRGSRLLCAGMPREWYLCRRLHGQTGKRIPCLCQGGC